MDEAGNLPKIEDLKQMVTIGLGRNIFFDFYIQSLQQFESVYGKDGEIIYGNCGNKVYLMAGDDDTPEKFSKTDRSGNGYGSAENRFYVFFIQTLYGKFT